jgi:hypothetical protein
MSLDIGWMNCPYRAGVCAHIWKMGRRASIAGKPIADNPYQHRRSPQYTRAWVAGYESWSLRPKDA